MAVMSGLGSCGKSPNAKPVAAVWALDRAPECPARLPTACWAGGDFRGRLAAPFPRGMGHPGNLELLWDLKLGVWRFPLHLFCLKERSKKTRWSASEETFYP